MSKQRN